MGAITRILQAAALVPVTVLAIAAAPPAAPAAPVGAAPVARDPDRPSYYWRWSDGSQQRERTFRQQQFRVPEHLPALVVSAYPARAGIGVRLEYFEDGRWRVEDSGRTNSAGQVRLRLNPYCEDGRWCDRTLAYRAAAGGSTAALSVRFTP